MRGSRTGRAECLGERSPSTGSHTGDYNPVEIVELLDVLGASSLSDAITRVDELNTELMEARMAVIIRCRESFSLVHQLIQANERWMLELSQR